MSELEPEVKGRELPQEVDELRQQVAEELRELDERLQPSIDAHIAAYAEEVERVIAMHKSIADETDLEIRAETRWSAIWELGGRCLAICRVVLHDLRGGFTSEAVGSLRALYEATVLLGAIAFHGEEDTLRQWLADEDWVRPKQARAVIARKQDLAKERMREAGLDTSGRNISEIGGEVYDLLSRPAHHRRGGSPETVQPDLREFTYGPHPSAEVRARHLDYAGELVETALLVVIDSRGDMIGRDYVKDALLPMQARLEEVRARFPLP